jgi:hypothetical protein
MKAHKKRMNVIRSLAIAACAAGLAAPAGAAAMPYGPHPVRVYDHSVPVVPDQGGARLDHRGLTDGTKAIAGRAPSGKFKLPAAFRTDAQTPSTSPAGKFKLPAGFTTDAQTPSTSPTSAPASVVTQIRTVVHDASRTLPIVLAACALGIALCGSGYTAYRLTRIQRRLVATK